MMILIFSINKIVHILKNYLCLIQHVHYPSCVVWHFINIEKFGNNISNDLTLLIIGQNLLWPQRLCIRHKMVESYEHFSYAILYMVLSKINTEFSFTFSCRSLKIQNKMMFSFFNRIVKYYWNYSLIFFDYFYAFVSSNVVCRFEVIRTSLNIISNVVNFGYYFLNLIHFKILKYSIKLTNYILLI